jgi:hypothetical protein
VDQKQFFLLVAAIGLTPIALSYGAMPQQILPWLFGIPIVGTNEMHIFRAVMRLYLALAAFWTTGAFQRKYRSGGWTSVEHHPGRLATLTPDGICAGRDRLRRGGLAAVAPG